MKITIHYFIGWVICSSITQSLQAQVNQQQYEIGIQTGPFIYQGDLTPSALGSFKTLKNSIGINGSKILNASFLVRGNLFFAKLRGNEALYIHPEYRQERSFSFSTPVIELSSQLVWNPLARNYADRGLSPYLFAGAGLSYLNIKPDWSNMNTEYFNSESPVAQGLLQDQQQQLPRLIPVLPIGLGVRYNLSARFAVTAESAYRLSFTDYMDGFSQSVNPAKNDHYHSTTIGLIYRLGKKNTMACPVIKQ
jgi:Domain of unknown function (DUF6089)